VSTVDGDKHAFALWQFQDRVGAGSDGGCDQPIVSGLGSAMGGYPAVLSCSILPAAGVDIRSWVRSVALTWDSEASILLNLT
jgi:hypothetical protein